MNKNPSCISSQRVCPRRRQSMTSYVLNQFAFAIILSLGMVPHVVQAQQLQQPESVLPWTGRQPEIKLALRPPLAEIPENSSAWLVDPVNRPAKASPANSGLHMVETEKFVDLGPLEAEPNQRSTRSPSRRQAGDSQTIRPLNIFRALGIQANRPRSRN